MTYALDRPCGYFWVTLIWSADEATVEVSFSTIAGWSGRRVRVPACITRMLPPDSGAVTCVITPGHSSETLNGRVRDLRGPSGYEFDVLLVRGYFAAGRVTAIGEDSTVAEWIAPQAPPCSLPTRMFLTRPKSGELFELGGGTLREPQSPHVGMSP